MVCGYNSALNILATVHAELSRGGMIPSDYPLRLEPTEMIRISIAVFELGKNVRIAGI
jgi:hypothetical protein